MGLHFQTVSFMSYPALCFSRISILVSFCVLLLRIVSKTSFFYLFFYKLSISLSPLARFVATEYVGDKVDFRKLFDEYLR